MPCAESERVQAHFDGELDAASVAPIEAHLETCAECRALLEELEQVRAALRQDAFRESAPAALRARVMTALDGEKTRDGDGAPRRAGAGDEKSGDANRSGSPREALWHLRSFWLGLGSGATTMAAAAALLFFIWMPSMTTRVPDDLLSAHLRSLMPGHLIDVASTDRHTVKPWFSGHSDVSPVVADFEQQGYRLVGGRADYFDHQRAAAVVYQHGSHVINVFSWVAGQALPKNATRNGYHLVFWTMGDLAYCAVSDTGWDELLGLTRLLRDLGARDESGELK